MNVKNIPGLWSRGDVQIARSKNIEDLDKDLPKQAWHLLNMRLYRAHNWHLWTGHPAGGYATVQTSLGCSFHCSFCCIQAPFGDVTPKMRFWNPKNIADQIDELVNGHGITNIKIADEMFCLKKKHVREICDRLIVKGIGKDLNIWAYARVDTVGDTDLLAWMRKAGFRWLGIGIESGSAHVRDGVEKGRFDTAAIEKAISGVRAAGINVAANYIFGLPDDTKTSMLETLNLAIELNTEWANFYCAMAYPGSQLHKEFSRDNPAALPEAPGGPGWIGYSQHAWASKPLPTATLSSEEVLDFRDDAFLSYFDRKTYLDMVDHKFGSKAGDDCRAMVERGRPARKHRRDQAP